MTPRRCFLVGLALSLFIRADAGHAAETAPEDRPAADRSLAAPTFQLAGLFRTGVVLQRDKPLPVWGWCEPGGEITVSLAGRSEKASAGPDGRWQVTFPAMPAGGPHELKAVLSGNGKEILCQDILVGEVWLLSGQSNMGGPLPNCTGGRDAARAADFPAVRLAPLLAARVPSEPPRLEGVWWEKAVSQGDPEKLRKWGGIHFAFGTELHQKLGVPVGLLAASRGGTSISTWTSLDVHRQDPSFRAVLEEHQKRKKDDKKNAPGLLYHQLIEPAAPFAIRGVLWYQGENDTGRAEAYRSRFPTMIESWRHLWQEPALPFLFVQLAYNSGRPAAGQLEAPGDEPWAELREAQALALAVPHTAMAVSHDLVRPENDVHYSDKMPVGHRLALAALATVYGRQVAYQGPAFREMKIEADEVRLFFDHAPGGLVAQGGGPLGGFAIAGEDRKWVWADEAVIDGGTVTVSSRQVPRPAAVRYAWTKTPCGANLFNKAGLPAPNFRTDDWPLTTAGKQ